MRYRSWSSQPEPARAAWPLFALTFAALGLAAALASWWAYDRVPAVRFRVQSAWAQVRDVVAPHPDILPTPAFEVVPPTFALPSPVPSLAPSATLPAAPEAAGAEATATRVVPTPLPSPTPPARVELTGFRHEYQLFNNCGPASLAINLSYWGWDGNQKVAAKILKPSQDDKNVSPRELYEYMLTLGYDAYIRVNGDLETLKRFIAAGYPVLVEKGLTCEGQERCTGWFGHYSIFTGYDDDQQIFITQDSYRGPDLKLTYDEVVTNWRPFNFLYMVIFPAGPGRDAEVLSLLGEAADLDRNYRDALARAQGEALTLSGQDAAFAWFNVGTNLHYLRDYAGAAAAYDQARKIGLPYRMVWYQFGPYLSYYYMARYRDVVDIATFAIDVANTPGLEEAYYWRGQAQQSLGFRDEAIADYRTALDRNPRYQPAREALVALGEVP